MEECGGGASREAEPSWTPGFKDGQRNLVLPELRGWGGEK